MFICYNYYPQQPGNNYGSLFMVIQNFSSDFGTLFFDFQPYFNSLYG